ncbi:hypothetical protein ACFFHX_17735 [Sphingobium indicum]|uniref:Uncharacterized protein n=1 Tax=Sphingobium indicum (strain DSM 16413 / CCM 7287 / MTCC 6362 / UT26 / NBRC 101211 / UT26S) TaxID=452662 RepID=D4Z5G8_SPHIU|nr:MULTISPECIES: hypothetical protein [Sphingobium]WDA38684.1 hypothetical protein PO876_11135 [Sphingobium sp. YC-XJ3]BAI97850.1 hypothetical protein SJA_C1-30160 [Sphingobium indicum UT26S]
MAEPNPRIKDAQHKFPAPAVKPAQGRPATRRTTDQRSPADVSTVE